MAENYWREPDKIASGDTLNFTRRLVDYPASAGWQGCRWGWTRPVVNPPHPARRIAPPQSQEEQPAGQHDHGLDGVGDFRRDQADQRGEAEIDEQDFVLRMVDDVDDVVGMQTGVDGVAGVPVGVWTL